MRFGLMLGAMGSALLVSACGGGADEPAAEETAVPAVEETAAAGDATAAATAAATPAATESAAAADSATPTPSASASAAAAPAAPAAAATPPQAFNQCKVCHSTEKGKHGIGPSLAGVYGTKAGGIAGFQFSDAMKASGLVWNDATLDTYLKAPMKVVPGTKMSFAGISDDTKRKEVIAYLKSLK